MSYLMNRNQPLEEFESNQKFFSALEGFLQACPASTYDTKVGRISYHGIVHTERFKHTKRTQL